jgi:tRNA G46 methylase TrmB
LLSPGTGKTIMFESDTKQAHLNERRVGSAHYSLTNYYRFHAPIYDWTRWSFLFGRSQLMQDVIALRPRRVLEIGCGTGSNLIKLAKALPQASIVGIDLSEAMLCKARQKSHRYSNISLASTAYMLRPRDLMLFCSVMC